MSSGGLAAIVNLVLRRRKLLKSKCSWGPVCGLTNLSLGQAEPVVMMRRRPGEMPVLVSLIAFENKLGRNLRGHFRYRRLPGLSHRDTKSNFILIHFMAQMPVAERQRRDIMKRLHRVFGAIQVQRLWKELCGADERIRLLARTT